jgi:hypothetical protein
MSISHPVKFIKNYITNVTSAGNYPTAPFTTVNYRWNATLSIPTAQMHGDTTTTRSGIYNGLDVIAGDYIASTGEGRVLKIASITSQTANSVACILEDVDIYNALQDVTQSYDGLISNGLSNESYIFSIQSGKPILASIPLALPGNLPSTFASAIAARFDSVFPNTLIIGDGTTKKITKDVGETLNLVAGTNITLGFDDTTNTVTVTGTPTSWAALTSKPTNISGFGITNAVSTDGGTLTGPLTLAADPSSALGAATKQYVDNAITGLDFKASVKVVAASNITLSGAQTVDGIALVASDRVLVAGQTLPATNGIYVVAAGAWSRSSDADNTVNTGEVSSGMYCLVEQGTNANSGWVLSTTGTITLGTTALAFTQFTGTGQITAGSGITKTGNTLSLTANATTVASGLMSSADKSKLDSYATPITGSSVDSVFQFTVNFDGASGNPLSTGGLTELPAGWSYTVNGADVTVTHTAGTSIKTINYWGRTTSTGTDHFRSPTSANELTIPYANINTKFIFRINTSIAGADAGGTARIIAHF